METQAGIELTKEEIAAIKSLKRAANKFNKATDRLWLFSASGTLHVMMDGDTATNTEPDTTDFGGRNQDNSITTINIRNDGGDW